jgi:hypothetical protein
MPPRCRTCSHPQLAEIDAAIIAGASLRNIAQRFDGPSPWSIYRHTKHAQSTLLAGITARDATLRERLRDELEQMLERERQTAQKRVHTLITAAISKRGPSEAEWKEAIDGLWGGYARIISYLLRLLKDGAGSRGPNSHAELLHGVSRFPDTGLPRLRRAQ